MTRDSGFDRLERRRLAAIARRLDAALEGCEVLGAAAFHAQLHGLFTRIASGELTAPIRRAPGMRHFLESNLPGHPAISDLYSALCRAVEGKD